MRKKQHGKHCVIIITHIITSSKQFRKKKKQVGHRKEEIKKAPNVRFSNSETSRKEQMISETNAKKQQLGRRSFFTNPLITANRNLQ